MTTVPPVGSKAPYIIICSGRTAEMGATGIPARVVAVSNCAAQLCAFLEVTHGKDKVGNKFREVSDLQHYLMDNMKTMKKKEADEKIKEMFRLLYQLEDEFEEA